MNGCEKNVVMGAGINFDEQQLKNFILSFREVNPKDDLILFVDSKQIRKLQNYFDKYNVIFKCFHFHEMCDTPIHNARYIKCFEFLVDHKEYKNVLLSDTKDVIFQSDPFENLNDEFLYFFQENTGAKIIDDMEYNGTWIANVYSPEILEQIKYNNIICSGVILGSYNKILRMLEKMKDEFLRIKRDKYNIFTSMILDQAIANYLGRVDEEFSKEIVVNQNGNVVGTIGWFHCGNEQRDEFLIRGHHILVNGKSPSILHQYDRDSLLKEAFDKKYQL